MKNDKASFSIIDLRTGLYLRTHEYTETDQVGHLDLNRNGRLIVSAHYDESGYIWRMPPFEKHALYQLNVVTDTNRRIKWTRHKKMHSDRSGRASPIKTLRADSSWCARRAGFRDMKTIRNC